MFRRKAHGRAQFACAWQLVTAGMSLGLVMTGHAYATGSASVPSPASVHTSAAESAQTSVHDATLRKAHDWLQQGQAKTAYSMLAPLESELAGQTEFDWLFGQAALNSDRPSEAAFAFERCLAMDSTNGLCRLGIARAHISLQEVASARDELEILSQASPPSQVQDVIADYLGLLSNTEASNQDTRLTSYLQLGIGYDSNINNATSRNSMALPLFNNMVFRLSDEGKQQESGFAQARFNISYSTPIATHWRFLTEANVSATGNWDNNDYNTLVSDLSVGLARRANKHQFIARLQGQNYRLGDRDYRNLIGVLGQYAYAVTDQAEFSVFAQGSRLMYPRQSIRNANRYTLGTSWTQGLANDRAVAYLSGYGGQEHAIRSSAPDNYDYKFAGLRAGGMYLVTPRMQIEAGVGAERRRYDGNDFLFQKARRDTFYDAYLGFNYAINRKLSLRPQYRYSRSNSNITLHDYDRHVVTFNLRYELF